jgi:general secretion pathway protein G
MSEKRFFRRFMIGIAVAVFMAGLGIPSYKAMIRHSRESVLQLNLVTIRTAIKQYVQDKRRAPQSLQELADAGYFRALPIDPTTNSNSTWKPDIGDVVISAGKTERGIADVHSGQALSLRTEQSIGAGR